MSKKKPLSNWVLDAALFVGLLVAFLLDLTGLELHQWLGVAVGVVAVYHLIVHWPWVEAVTGRFLGRTSGQARLYYVIDAGLATGFLSIVGTGLAMSSWLGLSLPSYAAWWNVHVHVSIATLGLIVTKIGLHWKWIVGVGKRYLTRPAVPVVSATARQPAPEAGPDRREFLRLMGVVGASAFLAAVPALEAALNSQAGRAQAGLDAESPPVETTAAVISQAVATAAPVSAPTSQAVAVPTQAASQVSSACSIRCNKQCSAPGRCGRYADTNGNGRCDLGECLA